MRTKITTILITILFSVGMISSVSMAGNRNSTDEDYRNPRKVANFNMLQDELNDPYRSSVETVNKRFQETPTFTNKRRDNYYMLLEELEY